MEIDGRIIAVPEKECPVDQGIPIVDNHRLATDGAVDIGAADHGQLREDETARLVVPVRTFVFQADMNGISFVQGQPIENGPVLPMFEDVSRCRVLLVELRQSATAVPRAHRC